MVCCGLCLGYVGRGQEVPAIRLRDSARMFGPGRISTGDFVFNTSFSPDGNTVYFSKAAINWVYIAIFYSTKRDGQWTVPQPVPFTGVYRDTDPCVSADGKRLYFCSDRPAGGRPFKDYAYKLFYVELDGNKVVSEPVQADLPLPVGMHVLYPSFAGNGDLYFTSSDTATNDADIYECPLVNGVYQAPVRLPFNDAHIVDMDPVVAADERFIIFASSNRKGHGAGDLWVSFKKEGQWGTPVNMGEKVNTAGHEGTPGLSRDNKTLYFSTNRESVKSRPQFKTGEVTAETINRLLHSPAAGLPQIYAIDISDLEDQGK